MIFLLKIKKIIRIMPFLKFLKISQFNIDFQKLHGMPVFELAEEVIRLFSLNSIADPFVQFFLDAVMRFSRKNSTSTAEFLEWWETQKDKLSVIIPEGLERRQDYVCPQGKRIAIPGCDLSVCSG